jgi:hypothetical protein
MADVGHLVTRAFAAALGGGGTLLDQGKLQLALDAVNAVEDDSHAVS